MSLGRSLRASVAGEKPRRPQFVRIAKILGLAAGEINQPSLGLDREGGLAARARTIIERRQWAFGHRALDAALDGLVMQSEPLAHGKKGWVFPIGQQYPRPLDPTRRFRSRLRHCSELRRIRICEPQFNRPPPRRHLVQSFSSKPQPHI